MLKELQKAEDLFIADIPTKNVSTFITFKISHTLREELRIIRK